MTFDQPMGIKSGKSAQLMKMLRDLAIKKLQRSRISHTGTASYTSQSEDTCLN